MTYSTELRAFVEAAKQHGATDDFLVALLREKGWPATDVYAVLAQRYTEQSGVSLPEPPGRLESAREAFFHLLAFVTLGMWVFSIGSIWFDLIDTWVPDPTAGPMAGLLISRVSRQLASIIVAFPAFVWATRSILRDQVENPDKAESAVRRWVSNSGLLITGLVCLADLIAFVSLLLQGELTARFFLRCFVILLLAGTVFLYYSRGLGKSRALPPVSWHRMFAWCAGAAIVLTLVCGFWSTGSPSALRVVSEDTRRLRDLYSIAARIQLDRTTLGLKAPPPSLDSVNAVKNDPFNGRAYEYEVLDDERFQLCAEFSAASPPDTSGWEQFWAHPPGRNCFNIAFRTPLPYPPSHRQERR